MGFSATESENIFVWSVPARLTPKTISVPVGASPAARSSTLRGARSSRATLACPIIRTRSNEASDPRPSPGGAFPRAPALSIASVPRDPRRGGALNGPSTPKADRALTRSGRDLSVDPRDCDNSGARISHLDPTGRFVSQFPLHGNQAWQSGLNRSTQLGKSGSADGAASYRKTGGLVPCRSRLRPAIFSFNFPIARNY